MDVYWLSDDKVVHEDSLDNINPKQLTWIRLTPDDAELFQKVAQKTKIPAKELKDFVTEDDEERARFEQFRFVKIIYRTPYLRQGEVATQPLCIFSRDRFIVTIQKANIDSVTRLEHKLEKNLVRFLFKSKSTGRFISHLLDKINDEFFQAIERIPSIVGRIQSNEFSIPTDVAKQLYSANITLSHFNQAIQSNLEVLFSARKSYSKQFTPSDRDSFNDLYYDTLHLMDTEKTNRDIISNIFNLQSIIAGERVNELFKKLASYALIIAVPTLISGIYGMNVKLPLQEHPYAFWLILGSMMVLSATIFFTFKRISWI